jgi:hypothetical protein
MPIRKSIWDCAISEWLMNVPADPSKNDLVVQEFKMTSRLENN